MQIKRERILLLVEENIRHFQSLMASVAYAKWNDLAPNNVNQKECMHYMRIREGISEVAQNPDMTWNDLAPFEKAEILEALE